MTAFTLVFFSDCAIMYSGNKSVKREITRSPRGLLIVYRVGIALMIALILVLMIGSLYALFRPSNSGPLFRMGGAYSGVSEDNPYGAVNIFAGIGRLRIPLHGNEAATVVISISFPYPADDRAFSEELATHTGDFRSLATQYFGSLPAEKMIKLNESAAKTALLEQYNALLHLGKIETLYFGDYMVVK
jgi:flagellar basal body-associated protein FliL